MSWTCVDSPRGIYPRLLELCFDYLCHLSKSLAWFDSPRGIYPWLLEMRIGDLIIRPSSWLVMTRQGGFLLDFWNHGSVILPSVTVVHLWWLAKLDLTMTFGIMDRRSYYPSKSLTCDDSPRGIYPWLLKLCFNDLSHLSESLTCGDSQRMISPLTFVIMWIYDPIKHQSRWLAVICQGDFSLTFEIMFRWS